MVQSGIAANFIVQNTDVTNTFLRSTIRAAIQFLRSDGAYLYEYYSTKCIPAPGLRLRQSDTTYDEARVMVVQSGGNLNETKIGCVILQ